jgi:hypothetical protein
MRASYSLHGQRGRATRATDRGWVRIDLADPLRDTPIRALARRLERETGCSCYPVRHDSDNRRADGSIESSSYEVTFVRDVPRRLGGGCNVMGSCWVTLRREAP